MVRLQRARQLQFSSAAEAAERKVAGPVGMTYIRDMLTGLDLRTVAVTLTLLCLTYGTAWALYQGIIGVCNFVRCVHILKADVFRMSRQISSLQADKMHGKVNYVAHTPSAPPPLRMSIPPLPPTLPTVDGVDWSDDDNRPSAETHVKSP